MIARSGWCRSTTPEQLVGVADGGDDVLAGVGEDAGQPGPEEHGVLGDHDPHGSSTRIVVGPPSGLITYIVPPMPATRSRSPCRPGALRRVGAAVAVVADLDDESVAGRAIETLARVAPAVAGDVRRAPR